jgi:hypothetical protein
VSGGCEGTDVDTVVETTTLALLGVGVDLVDKVAATEFADAAEVAGVVVVGGVVGVIVAAGAVVVEAVGAVVVEPVGVVVVATVGAVVVAAVVVVLGADVGVVVLPEIFVDTGLVVDGLWVLEVESPGEAGCEENLAEAGFKAARAA